jgi:HD superfamily phosphodiesterase
MFYAHSTENPDRSDWQTLQSHLVAVGRMASLSASTFGAGPLAEVAGLLHDLGKYTREFQLRLVALITSAWIEQRGDNAKRQVQVTAEETSSRGVRAENMS